MPAPDSQLCYMSAREALARFRDRTLSPVELMAAVIAQAEAVGDQVNAFSFRFFDQAMDAARQAEQRYLRSDGRPRPLEGLPLAIKDEGDVAGQPVTNGSLIRKDDVATRTAPANQRLLDAGAIVHARTTTPEFSCAAFTHSRLWGVTRNPWNLDYTPGGSSGGSGAALAAGMTTLATGSDIGGSIRIPASCCGLIGFKPPYGRVPEDPPFNMDAYNHPGPMARTVADSILMQNVLCGPHPLDQATLRPKLVLEDRPASLEGWRIAYSPDLGFFRIDPEVRARTEAAVEVLRDLGAVVETVEIGWTWDMLTAGRQYLEHLFGGWIGRYLESHGDLLAPYTRAFAQAAQGSTATQFLRAQEISGVMYATVGPLLEDYRLLVTPTTALPAVPADYDQTRQPLVIDGQEVADRMLGWVLTTPFNTLSRCPVVSVPSGRAGTGVPTGLQLIGRTYCDQDVMDAASAFTQASGVWFTHAHTRPALSPH